MVRSGKGTQVTFGKVTVYSDEEGLSDVYATFAKILLKFGYPEDDLVYEVEEEDVQSKDEDDGDESPWAKG